MDYPILQWDFFGGSLLIALVSTIHVFIAHFAVGGGLFIAIMETRVQRLGLVALKDYLHRYARFFMYFTMVVGGLTGVGIWFAISIVAPGGTSVLIHTFAYGWATEWTFFLAEIVTLLAYMRSFEAERSRRRLVFAWLYCLFAVASLTIVQGFISFMLTPGDWLETSRFWEGFFNPTFLPGLCFRVSFAVLVAGVFGLLTAQNVTDMVQRKRLARFCAAWTIVPLPLLLLSGWWHIQALSPAQQALAYGHSPELAAALPFFCWLVPIVFITAAALTTKLPPNSARLVAACTLAASFLLLASFEYMREAARRPYLITGYLYSNGIKVDAAKDINAQGLLSKARWTRNKTVTADNILDAGREIFVLECSSCHSRGGPMLDILPRSAKYTTSGMEALLTGLGKIGQYMPPFLGTTPEKKALAAYLTKGLHGTQPAKAVDIKATDSAVPAFDAQKAEYVLTAAADKGINMLFDAEGRMRLDIGTQGITAQLIRRDASPELVSKGVSLRYSIEGQGSGTFTPQGRSFRAQGIKLSPYVAGQPGQAGFAPYPLATIEAVDQSGKIVAQTKLVLPVSSELGCKNCHGGPYTHEVAGISETTAKDLLKAHDRLSLTSLAGRKDPVDCASCHDDKAQGGERSLNLSAAVHGLHAVYLAGRGADACNMCHPTDPAGATRALRDPHPAAGIDCTNCHGSLEDHALSLLSREKAQGVSAATRLMGLIKPREGAPVPRAPWVQQPQCVSCHTNFGSPDKAQAFGEWNKTANDVYWAKRDDLDAVACSSCHGSAHAVYPAKNPYGQDRDNLQPLQYQGLAKALGAANNCKACHTVDMDIAAHHAGMGLP